MTASSSISVGLASSKSPPVQLLHCPLYSSTHTCLVYMDLSVSASCLIYYHQCCQLTLSCLTYLMPTHSRDNVLCCRIAVIGSRWLPQSTGCMRSQPLLRGYLFYVCTPAKVRCALHEHHEAVLPIGTWFHLVHLPQFEVRSPDPISTTSKWNTCKKEGKMKHFLIYIYIIIYIYIYIYIYIIYLTCHVNVLHQAACGRKLNNGFYIMYQSGHCRPPEAVLCPICIAIVHYHYAYFI